ncbi:SAM-dependent methyltransferase [Actinokineospora baliensis]|uniref:class I SAM-dependent methyltransferase n=1 Tax=Actinokineospora baliensis TaxID=547056 RepID=UPI00195DA434|nr:class I SAM-dependent methyltransferase [Actinokineospora baliensis]MBM7772705.1 SAM-dependent methyltransferase [Actinokineospora baliensis]
MPIGPTLPLTGERTVPGIAEENYWFRRHEIAYLYLAPLCAGKTVLEAGCGEGYGAALLAEEATVVGLDYDELSISHVAKKYPAVHAVRGNLAGLPLRDGSLDVVANLQVIEHLWDQEGFLRECRRVLRPGGHLLITTPNRITFSPGRDTPLNPFHTRELAPSELDEMVRAAGFTTDYLGGVHHGPRLRELDSRFGGSIIDAQVEVVVAGAEWPEELLTAVAGVEAGDFEVTDRDLDGSLDIVLVARA